MTIHSPRLLTAILALAMGANHITLAQTSRPDVDETEFAAARAMLRDAAVRMDEPAPKAPWREATVERECYPAFPFYGKMPMFS